MLSLRQHTVRLRFFLFKLYPGLHCLLALKCNCFLNYWYLIINIQCFAFLFHFSATHTVRTCFRMMKPSRLIKLFELTSSESNYTFYITILQFGCLNCQYSEKNVLFCYSQETALSIPRCRLHQGNNF